jgi:predicted GNAT family N-acyltransferase
MPDKRKPLDLSGANQILSSKRPALDLSGAQDILKKKVATKSVSQEELWGSDSQPQDLYTSLATGAQEPQQVSDGLDGAPSPILKGLPSVESLKKKPIQPKKDVIETIKDVVPVISKNLSIEKEDFSEATQKARKESKTLIDKKQINQRVSEVGNIQNEYIKSLKEINILKKELSDEKSDIDYQISIGNNTPEFQEKITLHNNKVKENLNKFNLLKDKSEIISYNKKVIESASGNLLRKKAEQGNWFGALYNKMLEGVSSMSSGAASLATDLISEAMPSEYLLNPKELKELKDKGLDQDKIDDYIKKSAKKDILPIIRKSNVELLGDKGTTKEYIEKKQASSLLAGGVLGLAESAPAMIGGVYGRAANFFLMGTDAVNKEMESNPDFKNITENEKLAVTIPIGIANAVLEEFGLQNIIKNNSLVNKLIHKTLLKVGANSSANVFRRAMNDEVKSGLAAGVFKLTTGFAGEAVTGGSQQAAEIGVKDIYNVIKDKRMFQTPETLSDAIYEISDAAIMEGIGGTIMSTLPAINKAINNNELGKKSSDFEFELLDNINENSDEFKRLFVSDLKNKIIDGKIDKEEANSQLESFDKMISTFNKMPKDMSVEDKKKSFDLLVEKDNLTEEINGKDESLSVRQKERISEINKELSDISLSTKPVVEAAEPFVEDIVTTTVEEPTIKDSQIPLKRETFEFESAEGEMLDVEVTTNKDGTRLFLAKNKDGRVISSNKVGEDNTLTTEEYVTKGYGDIQGEVKVEQGNDIMAPAMKDKLTPKQKAELGIEEAEVTPEVTTTTETEPITEEVATEAKPIETIEAKAKAYSEELDKTKESDPEAYWSVSPVSAEDAAKGTIIDTPDGAAIVKPDGDIAGLFKKATSKAKGVAQDLLKRAVAAGGKKLDNFDTYLTPQYIKAGFRVVSRVPFSLEYGVPDGYNKEKHGTPDVVAMVYDPEGKLDIEEKTFDDYDEAMAYRDSFIEPSIEMELEGLAKLFDESDRGFKMSQVDKAKEALKSILPGVKFIVHETNEAYNKAVGDNSSGAYIYRAEGDKVIHINKQKANGRTVAHEVFHAVILDKIKGDKSVQEITARMMKAVYKTASPELKSRLDEFAARYSDESIRDEERLAELIGIIADGYPQMSQINKGIVKRWLDALAKMFGRKSFTDNEVIDLLNTLARKVSTGEVVSEEDISILGYGSIGIKEDIKRESKFIDSLVFNRFPTNKNTKVIENFDLSTIDGQVAASTLSDKLTAGEFKKYKTVNGEKVLEAVYTFFGGIGYPEVTGRVWAASKLSAVKKIIDDMKVSPDGYRYLIPAVMSNVSHMSNKNMTSITMEVFKEAINNKELNKSNFKNLVTAASSRKGLEKFKDGIAKSMSGNISAIDMANNLRDYIISSDITFESRKKLLLGMVGNPKSGNPKFSTVGTFLSLATSLADPIAKEVNLYQVPVIIRTKGNLKPVKTKKDDKFYHDSYGYHIDSDQEIEVLHLDDVYNLTDIIPEFTKSDGTVVSTENELNKKRAKAWDIKKILTNLGRTHGLSKYSAKIVSKRQQVEEDKTIKRSQLQESKVDVKLNYKGKIYNADYQGYLPKTKNSNISIEEGAGMSSYNITSKDGSFIIGLIKGADFPGEKKSEKRGEVLNLRSETKGNGVSLMLDALYNMKKNGVDLVKFTKPSSEGKPFNDYLEREGYIEKVRESESGTTEYKITDNVISKYNEKPFPEEKTIKRSQLEKDGVNTVSESFFNDADIIFPNDHILGGYAVTDSKGKLIGRVKLSEVNDNTVKIDEVVSEKKGERTGNGSAIMNMVIDNADKNNTRLTLTANLILGIKAKGFETAKKLQSFYEKFGFIKGSNGLMTREPVTTKKLQQANTIDEMVRIAKEAKYSDAAISAFLKAKGYSVEKITNAVLSYDKKYIEARQKEEGIFTREGRNKLLASLDSFKRMFLSARSFLSKTTFIAKEGIDAGIKAQSKIASYLVSDLDNAIKKYDGDKEKLISDFDKFIRGEEVDLPDNFIEIGNAMRSHIDKLSYELIKSGAVDEYQSENIKKNIGSYLNRSYEVFDKKNWASKVDELTLQSAKNYLKKQLLSEATKEAKESGLDVDILLERKANQAIANLLNKENAQSFVSSGKTGSKDVSILKEKSDIPLEIRALMGEYTDPAQNYSRTIFKIASLVNNAKFLNTVKSNGMNVYLFKEKTGEFNTQIAGKESETMNPLNGLYTTKEIAGALKESAGILNTIETALPFEIAGTVKSTYEYYMKLLGSVKHLKTIESVGTHFKNVSGNVTFMLANGYFKPDAYRQSAKVIYNDFFNKTDKELREKMQEYIEAGIVDQSAVLGELRSMFKDEDFDKSFERRMNSEKLNPANSFIDKIKRLGKKTISIAENAYQAEDDYFKIVAYETEKSRYARAIYTKEYSDLSAIEKKDVTDKVSEMVKNILPNYGRVAGAVKMVKAFPIVGTFISFQTEALRTAYNIVNLSVTELKSSNPEIKKIGALRMTGIISSQAVKYAVMYLIGGAVLGDDDDEKKEKAKEFVAPWSKNSNIVITDESNGKFSYVDFSASDPFGGIVKPMNAALGGEDLLDGFVKGLQELVTPFTTPDILRSMFSDILENKNSYGGTLYNPSDSFENKSSAILARVYKTFEPGTVTSVRKIYGSDNPLNEMAGQFTGYKSNDVDILKDFGFKISAMKKKEIETRSIYNRAVNKFKNKEVTDAELQAAYLQSNKATIDNYKELKKSYDAALYFGTDRKEIKESMKDAYVSADVIRGIVTGKFKDLKKKKGIETDAQLKARNPLVYRKLMLFRARHRK